MKELKPKSQQGERRRRREGREGGVKRKGGEGVEDGQSGAGVGLVVHAGHDQVETRKIPCGEFYDFSFCEWSQAETSS